MCSDTEWIPGSTAQACECRLAGCLICEVESQAGPPEPPPLRYSLRRISDDRDMVGVNSVWVALAMARATSGWYVWDTATGRAVGEEDAA